MLQYVIGDYPTAVSEQGVLLDADEFEEQLEILHSVHEVLERAASQSATVNGDEILVDLEAVRAQVRERQPASEVQRTATALRQRLIRDSKLSMSPAVLPSLARGAKLYQESCVACHGADGRAQSSIAAQLSPRPTDLQAERLLQTLSAYQVFNLMTFGVPGTSMPSFAILSAAERWDIAFYVMTLRYTTVVVPKDSDTPDLALEILSQTTDAELFAQLRAMSYPEDRLWSAVAQLRMAFDGQ
jgi:high-affinity iron transporter